MYMGQSIKMQILRKRHWVPGTGYHGVVNQDAATEGRALGAMGQSIKIHLLKEALGTMGQSIKMHLQRERH